MKDIKFYINKENKQIVDLVIGSELHLDNFTELKANSVDAALEKHVPDVKIEGSKVDVTIGSVIHPMTEAHHIAFVILVTDKAIMRHDFNYTDEPKFVFTLGENEKPLKVYEYCNLHGLWVKEL